MARERIPLLLGAPNNILFLQTLGDMGNLVEKHNIAFVKLFMCEESFVKVLCMETIICVGRGKYSSVYEINELSKVHDHWIEQMTNV